MVNVLATCGDSFGCGVGLEQEICFEKSFAGLVAEHFNLPQEVFARAGCCNYTIHLQVKKVIEKYIRSENWKPFVLITATNHNRIFIPLRDQGNYKQPDLKHVDYEGYYPYSDKLVKTPRKPPFETETAEYISETIGNILEYQAGRAPHLIDLFGKLYKGKIEALGPYFLELYDEAVKNDYDQSLYAGMHLKLKEYNIPHLIMDHNNQYLNKMVKEFLQFNWGDYTRRYPDKFGSGHCNEEGNRVVSQRVIAHIVEKNLL